MNSIPNVKQELLGEIEKLPEYRLQEVLQFVSFLLYCQNQNSYKYPGDWEQQEKRDASAGNPDPLSEFIGAVSHGSLAQNSDTELYDN
jgi:hypothetical protein